MRNPPRLLIVSLLAAITYLPTAVGQQPGSVNIRQRVVTSAAGLPKVNVTVDRNRVPVGEEVTFTLSPADVVLNPNYIVTLDFGDDDKTEERKTKFVHVYKSPRTYTYFISIRSAGKKTPKVPQVFLFATPTAVTTNQTVNFSTQLSDGHRNIKYRFVFADGSQTPWQDATYTKHEYALPKTYPAYVDIGAPDARGVVERIGGSERVAIQVTSPVVLQKLSVSLSARPVRVEERQVVSFTAKVVSGASNVRYRFVFGDKSAATNWQINPQTRHRYLEAGNYSARVDVRVISQSGVQIVSSSPLPIEVKSAAAQPTVRLTATPATVGENLPVFFQARVDSQNETIRYRFDFGDGSRPTAWTRQAIETHAYSRAGNYAPYVEIGRATTGPIKAIASSSRPVTVTAFWPPDGVTPTPTTTPTPTPTSTPTPTPTPDMSPLPSATPALDTSPPPSGTVSPNIGGTTPTPDGPTPGPPNNWWWIYLLIALALFAGYQTWKWLAAPRPTFHPRLDPGVSKVETDLAIDFQLQLNPDIAAGDYGVETPAGSLIKAERKSDD